MALNLIDLFKTIKWAKNGNTTDMSQTNYEAGWAHLGDDTPTVEDFNFVQRMNDEKDQWLFNQIKTACEARGIAVTESDVNALARAITVQASLNGIGLTQLSSDTNSTLEDRAATPKAIKTLKDLIDSTTRNLNNYIPNSKKSTSVTSTSADTVATSSAVKTANDNANGRVSQAGDTMTGHLLIKAGDYASTRTYNSNGWSARWEGAPLAGDYFAAVVYANSSESVVNKIGFPKKNGTVALLSDIEAGVSNRILRDGNAHRIALSWTSSGLKASVDNGDLGAFVFEGSTPTFNNV